MVTTVELRQLQEKKEWDFALTVLSNYEDGTKLKRSSQKKSINYLFEGQPISLNHSFIVLGGKVLRMAGEGQYLGAGGFSAVKLADDQYGNLYALKITKPGGQVFYLEDKIAKDLGVAGRRAYRHDSGKSYIPYKYLGQSLNTYLKEHKLTRNEQFDLAIKVLLKVCELHSGHGSSNGKRYAHLDIKPENIAIDNGQVSLIDFGFAENLQGRLDNLKGTLTYLPADAMKVNKQKLDIFATLRTLWLPSEFKAYDMVSLWGITGHRSGRDQMIFTDEVVKQSKSLRGLIDTSQGKSNFYSIFDIVSGLILCKNNLFMADIFYLIQRDHAATRSLIQKYLQGEEITQKTLAAIINPQQGYLLQSNKLSPIFHLVKQLETYARDTFSDSNLKFEAVKKIKQDVYQRAIKFRLGDTAAFQHVLQANIQLMERLMQRKQTVAPLIFTAMAVLTGIGLLIGALQFISTEGNQFLFFKRRADSGVMAKELLTQAEAITAPAT